MMWEAVIGLEIHAELNTRSKMYCSCINEFGGVPNSRCCPVCTGMPGTLPMVNRQAVEYAVMAGLAINSEISEVTRQYRKNYFYPDLPKGYQISQCDRPLCMNGEFKYWFDGGLETAGIRQIHIEEDAGKLIHLTDGVTQIDYNRCGVPLIEIVTQPDFHSAEQARTFLEAVRVMLLYLGISDCRMQEGSLRCDVNVSVRPMGSDVLMPRVEMKNVNTFSGAERAIEYEIKRQIDILESGGEIAQETRRWDDEKKKSIILRSKENAADYRYFPEPDITPIYISRETVERLKETLPELEYQKRARYTEVLGIPCDAAAQICALPDVAAFFDKCIALGVNAKNCANLIIGIVSECINESGTELSDSGLTADSFADIMHAVGDGSISLSAGKKAISYVFNKGGTAKDAIDVLGLRQINDRSALDELVRDVLAEQPQAVADYAAGKKNAIGFITGQCMRKSHGSANPQMLAEIIKENLERQID